MIAQTRKAWSAGIAVALGTAIIKGIESYFAIDLPVEWETGILTAVTAFFTWLIPNAEA